jgi:hypothetical protein
MPRGHVLIVQRFETEDRLSVLLQEEANGFIDQPRYLEVRPVVVSLVIIAEEDDRFSDRL